MYKTVSGFEEREHRYTKVERERERENAER